MNLVQIRKKIDRLLAERAVAVRIVKQQRESLLKARRKVKAAKKGQKILQGVAEAVQKKVHDRISLVVSKCLKSIFREPYDFKIVFEQSRGRTQARPVFVRNGHEVHPLTGASGGMAAVAADLALRISMILMSRPQKRKAIFLDEGLLGIGKEYREMVRELLVSLSEELKIQIIVTTHDDELHAGKIVRL